MTFRQPFGVAAGVIPWNVPVAFFNMKVASAIAAGNIIVLKTSEKPPLTHAFLATLIQQAGFPPSVINVVHGHGLVSGATLAFHMDVRSLSFTGSGRTGRLILEASAKSNLKVVHLELGGKSPAIIFDGADIDEAARETQNSVTWNSGQVCMMNSRIYVQDTCAERFIAASKEHCSKVRIDPATDPATEMGTVADAAWFEPVNRYMARTKGEVFGPVVCINVFKSEEEPFRSANDSEFGLHGSVYTKDISRALRATKALEAGTVGVNCTSPTVAADLSMGGYKASGIGREGFKISLLSFLEEKTVIIKV